MSLSASLRHARRALAPVLAAVLAATLLVLGWPSSRADAATAVKIGAWQPNAPYDGMGAVSALESDIGRKLDIVHYYQGWAVDTAFNRTWADAASADGRTPMITWEPWDYRVGTAEQPAYRLATIYGGAHDALIRQWARDAKAWGKPLLLRFAHEMNIPRYPWSELANGNTSGEYVAAWRHVRNIFVEEGVTNVSFVWSPNVSYAGTIPLEQLYPGDALVDRLALDGYNGGTALEWGGWLTFEQIFGATLRELRAITTTKKVTIAEVASAEVGGDKAAWITDLFGQLPNYPEIDMVVWFNEHRETDWRIQSSASSLEAFRTAVAGSSGGGSSDDGSTPTKGNGKAVGRLKKFAVYSAAARPRLTCTDDWWCSVLRAWHGGRI